MEQKSEGFLDRASETARQLTILADEGECEVQDDGCIVMCSVIRDCAYKIRREVERERRAHRALALRLEEAGAVRQATGGRQ